MKPFYAHDCSQCQWLGAITYPAPHRTPEKEWVKMRNTDLYICNVGTVLGPDLIARFSSKVGDYASLDARSVKTFLLKEKFSTSGPALIAAYYFALAKGLIK